MTDSLAVGQERLDDQWRGVVFASSRERTSLDIARAALDGWEACAERLDAAQYTTRNLLEANRTLSDALDTGRQRATDYEAALQNHEAVATECMRLGRERDAAQARVAELEQGLRRYGWHHEDCPFLQEKLPCTCGFEAALRGEEEVP